MRAKDIVADGETTYLAQVGLRRDTIRVVVVEAPVVRYHNGRMERRDGHADGALVRLAEDYGVPGAWNYQAAGTEKTIPLVKVLRAWTTEDDERIAETERRLKREQSVVDALAERGLHGAKVEGQRVVIPLTDVDVWLKLDQQFTRDELDTIACWLRLHRGRSFEDAVAAELERIYERVTTLRAAMRPKADD